MAINLGTLSNLDLYPRFLKLYSISYNNTYGMEGWPLENWATEFTEEDHIILPTAPNTASKEFYCWSTSLQHVNMITEIPIGTTQNITIYPKFYQYIGVTYNMGSGGENNVLNPTKLSVLSDNFLYDPIVKPGYECLGWELSNTSYVATRYETEPTIRTVLYFTQKDVNTTTITLSAIYRTIEYRIGYYLDGGVNNESNPSLYTVNTSYTLSSPTRSGYAFVGWYTDENFQNPIQKIEKLTGNLTLFARWAKLNNQNAYEINSVEDLRLLSYINNITFDILLNADIDLQGEPITINKYSGVFDGKNHTIKNCSTSLFNGVVGGTIKNLNGTINICSKTQNPEAPWLGYGGFIAYATDSTIINCSVDGSISISENGGGNAFYIGGLVGFAHCYESTNTISQCSANVDIEVSLDSHNDIQNFYVGGLIGFLNAGSDVENCYSSGSIFVSGYASVYPIEVNLGGLIGTVGYNYSVEDCGSISNSYSTVNVKLDCNKTFSHREMNIGGFIGGMLVDEEVAAMPVSNCYSTGNVEICNKFNNPEYYQYAYTGGFVGLSYLKSDCFENCFTFSGQILDGGKVLTVYATATTMEDIWAYIVENWDSEIWDLSTSGNPTHK